MDRSRGGNTALEEVIPQRPTRFAKGKNTGLDAHVVSLNLRVPVTETSQRDWHVLVNYSVLSETGSHEALSELKSRRQNAS